MAYKCAKHARKTPAESKRQIRLAAHNHAVTPATPGVCCTTVLHWLPGCRHQPCRCCGGSQWLRIMRSEFSMHKHTRQYPRPCSCQIGPQLARQQRAQQPMGCTASAAAAIRHTLAASSMQPAALPIARHSCHSRPLHLITAPHLSPVLSPAPLFHSPALAPRVLHTRRPYTGRHSGKPPRGQAAVHATAWQRRHLPPPATPDVSCSRLAACCAQSTS